MECGRYLKIISENKWQFFVSFSAKTKDWQKKLAIQQIQNQLKIISHGNLSQVLVDTCLGSKGNCAYSQKRNTWRSVNFKDRE